MSKIGEEASIDSRTLGSELNVAVSAPTGPITGLAIHTIRNGSNPRIRKTAIKRPYTRNHRRARALIVVSTCALITALSRLLTASKSVKPIMIRIIEKISSTLHHFSNIYIPLFSQHFESSLHEQYKHRCHFLLK